MKAFLERRIRQQEEEVASWRSFVDVVDSLLAERSFRPMEMPQETAPKPPSRPTAEKPAADSIPIMTVDGTRIGLMQVEQNNLHVTPDPNFKFDSESPPLRSFLVAKVLEPMVKKDREAAAAGTIPPENMLRYSLKQEEGRLMGVDIMNYGDDRRLLELKNAIRWTLRRMHEKTSTGQKPT